jgi:hypothetical protein
MIEFTVRGLKFRETEKCVQVLNRHFNVWYDTDYKTKGEVQLEAKHRSTIDGYTTDKHEWRGKYRFLDTATPIRIKPGDTSVSRPIDP